MSALSHTRLSLDGAGSKRQETSKLPTIGHAIAGVMAGATVSFIAAPVEHIKARLQIQYAAEKSKRLYRGPIDCVRKIVSQWSNEAVIWGNLAKKEANFGGPGK